MYNLELGIYSENMVSNRVTASSLPELTLRKVRVRRTANMPGKTTFWAGSAGTTGVAGCLGSRHFRVRGSEWSRRPIWMFYSHFCCRLWLKLLFCCCFCFCCFAASWLVGNLTHLNARCTQHLAYNYLLHLNYCCHCCAASCSCYRSVAAGCSSGEQNLQRAAGVASFMHSHLPFMIATIIVALQFLGLAIVYCCLALLHFIIFLFLFRYAYTTYIYVCMQRNQIPYPRSIYVPAHTHTHSSFPRLKHTEMCFSHYSHE